MCRDGGAPGGKNKLARKGGSAWLKYPRRRQLNGQVRLIRAAETVKQAGGWKWRQERDVGSKVKTNGVRSGQNWGQNSSICPLVISSKD